MEAYGRRKWLQPSLHHMACVGWNRSGKLSWPENLTSLVCQQIQQIVSILFQSVTWRKKEKKSNKFNFAKSFCHQHTHMQHERKEMFSPHPSIQSVAYSEKGLTKCGYGAAIKWNQSRFPFTSLHSINLIELWGKPRLSLLPSFHSDWRQWRGRRRRRRTIRTRSL